LLGASAGVFLHAGIKFPWFVFFQKDSGLRPPDPPRNLQLSMWFFSALCIGLGVYPDPLYAILPYAVDYQPYTAAHLVTQFQLLLFAGFAFFVMLKLMRRTLTISLDFDWFYRKFLRQLGEEFTLKTSAAHQSNEVRLRAGLRHLISQLYVHHGPQGLLASAWPTGSMAIWAAVMLGLSLLLFYIL
jgi:multicomponent Na+:H+ antiporter subunit D